MSKKNVKFQLASNFESELIEGISGYDDFTWVYGKMNNDVIGGGRNSQILPKVSWKELEQHIALCHKYNIKFNYLLNSLCLGSQEFNKPFHKKLVKLLDRISEIKADGVTVASPYLCEMVKAKYPHFSVSCSDYNRITTMQQVLNWIEAGVDEITFFPSVNRDFKRLREFLIHTKNSGVILRLTVNNTCLHECHMHINHGANNSHSSRSGSFSQNFNIDFQVLSCTNHKIRRPTNFITSEWVRPEDVHHYEKLCDETGNYNLHFKLTDRSKTTEFLLRVAKAYHDRKFEGNLLDILNTASNKERKQVHLKKFVRKAVFGFYNVDSLMKMKNALKIPEIYVDNQKLDGFIDKFVNGYDCANKVCDVEDLADGEKSSLQGPVCSYCKTWKDKALKINEEEQKEWISLSNSVLTDIKNNTILSRFNKN